MPEGASMYIGTFVIWVMVAVAVTLWHSSSQRGVTKFPAGAGMSRLLGVIELRLRLDSVGEVDQMQVIPAVLMDLRFSLTSEVHIVSPPVNSIMHEG